MLNATAAGKVSLRFKARPCFGGFAPVYTYTIIDAGDASVVPATPVTLSGTYDYVTVTTPPFAAPASNAYYQIKLTATNSAKLAGSADAAGKPEREATGEQRAPGQERPIEGGQRRSSG